MAACVWQDSKCTLACGYRYYIKLTKQIYSFCPMICMIAGNIGMHVRDKICWIQLFSSIKYTEQKNWMTQNLIGTKVWGANAELWNWILQTEVRFSRGTYNIYSLTCVKPNACINCCWSFYGAACGPEWTFFNASQPWHLNSSIAFLNILYSTNSFFWLG